jgi:hypothetical protein
LNENQVILFPHSHIPTAQLSTLLGRFSGVVVCLPWFMDQPVLDDGGVNDAALRILRPSEALKPPEDFGRLLTEYREWVRQNMDRGYTAASASSLDPELEERLWKVRQSIRNGTSPPHGQMAATVLRWHMTLHLTREFQKHQMDMRVLIHRLKQQASPLQDALEESPLDQGLLEDLPEASVHPFVDDHHLGRVCEAWVGLFGDQLKGSHCLVTLDRCVMDLISGLFQTHGMESVLKVESVGSGESESASRACDSLSLPKGHGDGTDTGNSVVDFLVGKRILLCDG